MSNQPARYDDPFKGLKTGKWTKYGGSISGLKKERVKDTWFCQTCGCEMIEEIKPFLFELYPGEFIRLCPPCTHIATAEKKTVSIAATMKIVRRDH